ncbi:MAG: hypothetical protein GEV28_40955 [Actinophytocola sp.]|uniref:CoxG family protein n=1 Tax=Actinophytocola sp. TaxID=1872138 RepID=UPI001326365B|nr:SRPBCC domain-containing protein [Actinophytocola sp.]MPZ86406.1 hypothetical protein [Actinophytocola sp.]
MKVVERFEIAVPRDRMASAMTDVPLVASCVPGVEGLRQGEDGSWSATMVAQLGPMKTRFAGSLQVDGSRSPDVVVARGGGRDERTNSRVRAVMISELTELSPGRTGVDVVADVNLRGKLGQFGSGIVQAAASELTKDFVRRSEGTRTRRASALALVLRTFRTWARSRFARRDERQVRNTP